MKLLNKVGRGLTVIVMSPFVNAERRERDRLLQERLKRAEERHMMKDRQSQGLNLD